MKKYKVKIIEKSDFILDGKSRKDVAGKLLCLINRNIIDLPYTRKGIKVKIRKETNK